jgi:hypothetical protein
MNKRMVLVVPLGVLIGLLGNAQAQAAGFSNTSFPIAFNVFVPCANGGAGEVVALTGELHDMFNVTADSDGFRVDVHDNPQGISGRGLTTGNKYQATGVTRLNLNSAGPIELTYVNNFRIIGQGPGNNFSVHDNLHLKIDGDGDVTAFHDNFRANCK